VLEERRLGRAAQAHWGSFRVKIGTEQPDHGINIDNLSAKAFGLAFVLANLKEDIGSLRHKRIDGDRRGFVTHGVISNAPILQLPLVTPFDVILARGILEFVNDVAVATILLAGFGAFGMPAMPDNLWGISVALIVTASLGCGVGFINAVLQTLFRSWDKLWNNATRLFYFFSGIFRYYPANGTMPILRSAPVLAN
jgi:hypothetical protein